MRILIAPTAEDSSKIRFNIHQIVDGKCEASICALMPKEAAELFVHHLTSECASFQPECECGGRLEVL